MKTINTLIHFNGYRNLVNDGIIRVHEEKYALNIKSYVSPLYLENTDLELAYDNCFHSFMDMADMTVTIYGFSGFSIEGKSGGWLKLNNRYSPNKTIAANFDQYLPFEEFVLQEQIHSCFEVISRTKENIERIYKHSQDLKEVNELLKEILEGK